MRSKAKVQCELTIRFSTSPHFASLRSGSESDYPWVSHDAAVLNLLNLQLAYNNAFSDHKHLQAHDSRGVPVWVPLLIILEPKVRSTSCRAHCVTHITSIHFQTKTKVSKTKISQEFLYNFFCTVPTEGSNFFPPYNRNSIYHISTVSFFPFKINLKKDKRQFIFLTFVTKIHDNHITTANVLYF